MGHSPRCMRGASTTTLRRDASISATASSAGASGEPLVPRDTSTWWSLRRVVVDRPRPAADQRDQLEVGQPLDQRAREIDALADFDDALGRLQALDQLVEIARRRRGSG